MVQVGICGGDQFRTRPNEGRRMGVHKCFVGIEMIGQFLEDVLTRPFPGSNYPSCRPLFGDDGPPEALSYQTALIGSMNADVRQFDNAAQQTFVGMLHVAQNSIRASLSRRNATGFSTANSLIDGKGLARLAALSFVRLRREKPLCRVSISPGCSNLRS